MRDNRIDIMVRERGNGVFAIEDLPERYRMTQRDLDDLQRDMEPVLRSSVVGNGALGTYGSYRRRR